MTRRPAPTGRRRTSAWLRKGSTSAGLVSVDRARVSALDTSRGATSPSSSSWPAVAATRARSSGSSSCWTRSSISRSEVGSGLTAANVKSPALTRRRSPSGRSTGVRGPVTSCEERPTGTRESPEASKTATSRRWGRGSWSSVRLDDELAVDERDHVGAGLVEPRLRPGRQVAARGPRVAVHQVVEAGVGEGVAAEVVAQALDERVLADVGDELVQHALALDVGDGVEVGHRRRHVGDVAADRVASRAHVHLVGRALEGGEEGGPLLGELARPRHAPVGRPGGEGLVEPEVVPPLHRHEVAEPHVRHLVEDELRPDGALRVGRGSAEELAVAVGDAAPVLHRAAEVGHEDLVVALLRERVAEPLAEERQALPRQGDHLVEVALEDRHERLAAVEAEVVAVVLLPHLVERAGVDHDDVRRQAGRVGEGPDPRVVGLRVLDRLGRAVGGDQPRRRARSRRSGGVPSGRAGRSRPTRGGPRRARGWSRRRRACRWGRPCAGCPRRWRCWWCSPRRPGRCRPRAPGAAGDRRPRRRRRRPRR